ncbi:uncharacterized protein LOC105665484 [Ceratitis capitata]|nr:uncharacterized protein LOC105665484 [Ceratitis capitata]
MLPFQKSFNTEDTNSLKNCKDKCIQAGDKCQSLSFGVHRRGNGTCQLSTEKFSLTGGRPSGIIFDPDFDLYARKSNCFDLSDNTITDTTVGGGGEGDEGYGGLSPTPSIQLPNRPADPGTTLLVVDPTPTTSTTFAHERPSTGYSPSPSTTYGTTPGVYTDSINPTLGATRPDGDRLYFSQDIYPLYKYPTLYEHNYPSPNDDVYIPGGYASNVPEVHDSYRPPGHYPTEDTHAPPHGPPRPVFGLGYGNGFSYGRPESYDPTTARPYDQSSQADRDRDTSRPGVYTTRPGPYASDRPERPGSYPSERPSSYPSDRPDSYSSERPSAYPSQRPSSYPSDRPDRPNDRPEHPNSYPNDRPDQPGSYPSNRPDQHGSYPNDRPDRPMGPPNPYRPTRPDYDPTTPTNYYTRPEYDGLNRRPSYEQRPPSSAMPPTMSNGQRPPGDFIDYTSRPDPPNGNALSTSIRPPMRGEPGGYGGVSNGDYGYVRRNGTAARPDGGYDGDKTIATFFNPEDYLNGSKRRPGSGYDDRDEGSFSMDKMKGE